MNLLNKYRLLSEKKCDTKYDSGVGYSARVCSTGNGTHVAKFFKNGEYMQGADYENADAADVHEFAQDEMDHRKNVAKIEERISEPQGHLETADRISDDSKKNGVGPKKMMGNRTPLEIIARILARK